MQNVSHYWSFASLCLLHMIIMQSLQSLNFDA